MSRFKEIMKNKNIKQALSKHPLVDADEQVKKDYLQGLVFVAFEDENFSEEEKDYLKLLMQHLDVDESMMDVFEAFANDGTGDELTAFTNRLGDFEERLKWAFMIEVRLMALKDGSYDEQEKAIFEDYIAMLSLNEDKATIEHIVHALQTNDMDRALSLYMAKTERIESLDYLFELLEMPLYDEMEKLYHWQWIKWEFSYGAVLDGNLVASKPVTVRQIAVFMNALLLAGCIEQLPNSQCFVHKDDDGKLTPLIDFLEISNLQCEEGLFAYAVDDRDKDFVGASTSLPFFFSNLVNALSVEQVGLLTINVIYYMGLASTSRSYLTDSPEFLLMHLSYNNIGNRYKVIQDAGNNFDYGHRGGFNKTTASTFRLMKISDNN